MLECEISVIVQYFGHSSWWRVQTKRGPLEKGMEPLQYSCHETPRNSMKMQKDMTLEDELPRSKGVQFITREERRTITNSSRKNGVAGPKWK